MSNAVTSAFLVSLSSIAQVLSIIGAGALATHNGLFTTSTRSAFAKFNLKIFFPCLVLAIADDYNFEELIKYLPLMGASICHIIIGALLGYGAGILFKVSPPERHFLLLMTAFNNNGGLPFILMVPVCATWKRAIEEGDAVSILARSYVMIIIYGLPWTVMLFSLGKMIIVDAGQQLRIIEKAKKHKKPHHHHHHHRFSLDASNRGMEMNVKHHMGGLIAAALEQEIELKDFQVDSQEVVISDDESSDNGSVDESSGDTSSQSTSSDEFLSCSDSSEEEEDEEGKHRKLAHHPAAVFMLTDSLPPPDIDLDECPALPPPPPHHHNHRHHKRRRGESINNVKTNCWRSLRSAVLFIQTAPLSSYRQKAYSLGFHIRKVALFEPNITTAFASMLLACSGPFKYFFFEGPFSFVGGSLKSLGAPGPVISTMVLSGGLYASYFPVAAALHEKRHYENRTPLSSPNLTSAVPDIDQQTEVIVKTSLRKSDLQTTGDEPCTKNVSEVVDSVISPFHHQTTGDVELHPISEENETNDKEYFFELSGLRSICTLFQDWFMNGNGRLVLLICFLKLVALPAICYPLTAWLINIGILNKHDPLFQMIMLIESAVPSSQSVVSIVQIEAGSKCADRISALYLPMYLCAALTLSIAVALAIWIID